MTEQSEDHISPFGQQYMRDPCACAAYVSACSAPQAFATERRDLYEEVIYWPSLRPGFVEGGMIAQAGLCIDVLAPFIRANPKAPTEALYRHASAQGVHQADPNGWADLLPGQQASYEVFALVLLCLDGLADRAERQARSQNPQVPRADFVPVEDTILRGSGSVTDRRSGLAEERHVVITEGTGTAPGHAPARTPAPPAIGPDNTERPAGFFTQRQAPIPTEPLAASETGTSPELGHGFDPSQPFNETGAPPPGQAPASAADTIGGSTAIAAPPAPPAPAPDAPANPSEQERETDAYETEPGRELEAAPAGAAVGGGTGDPAAAPVVGREPLSDGQAQSEAAVHGRMGVESGASAADSAAAQNAQPADPAGADDARRAGLPAQEPAAPGSAESAPAPTVASFDPWPGNVDLTGGRDDSPPPAPRKTRRKAN